MNRCNIILTHIIYNDFINNLYDKEMFEYLNDVEDLISAIKQGELSNEKIEEILSIQDEDGDTLLHMLIKQGDIENLKILVEEIKNKNVNPNFLNIKNNNYNSILNLSYLEESYDMFDSLCSLFENRGKILSDNLQKNNYVLSNNLLGLMIERDNIEVFKKIFPIIKNYLVSEIKDEDSLIVDIIHNYSGKITEYLMELDDVKEGLTDLSDELSQYQPTTITNQNRQDNIEPQALTSREDDPTWSDMFTDLYSKLSTTFEYKPSQHTQNIVKNLYYYELFSHLEYIKPLTTAIVKHAQDKVAPTGSALNKIISASELIIKADKLTTDIGFKFDEYIPFYNALVKVVHAGAIGLSMYTTIEKYKNSETLDPVNIKKDILISFFKDAVIVGITNVIPQFFKNSPMVEPVKEFCYSSSLLLTSKSKMELVGNLFVSSLDIIKSGIKVYEEYTKTDDNQLQSNTNELDTSTNLEYFSAN